MREKILATFPSSKSFLIGICLHFQPPALALPDSSGDASNLLSPGLPTATPSVSSRSSDFNESEGPADQRKPSGAGSGVGQLKKTRSGHKSFNQNKNKRQNWFANAVNPTYKSRNESFKKIFPDLPKNERLVVGELPISSASFNIFIA